MFPSKMITITCDLKGMIWYPLLTVFKDKNIYKNYTSTDREPQKNVYAGHGQSVGDEFTESSSSRDFSNEHSHKWTP